MSLGILGLKNCEVNFNYIVYTQNKINLIIYFSYHSSLVGSIAITS